MHKNNLFQIIAPLFLPFEIISETQSTLMQYEFKLYHNIDGSHKNVLQDEKSYLNNSQKCMDFLYVSGTRKPILATLFFLSFKN